MVGAHEALPAVRRRAPLPRWFTIVERCPRCGLRFEREEGYWTGALAINIGETGAFAIVFVVAIALTAPDIPVARCSRSWYRS